MDSDRDCPNPAEITRRQFVTTSTIAGTAILGGIAVDAQTPVKSHPEANSCTITINGVVHSLSIDPRVTLLDLLRERLALTGAKKGCDHGQCGACTVLVNGDRINACLALAVAHDGHQVTTIEGLASGEHLHPMQEAFVEHDGLQCGYCTPGQICSAVALLAEARAGVPSVVTGQVTPGESIPLSDAEIRERMAGNICRCGAYPNIVAAVRDVSKGGPDETLRIRARVQR
jgi:xanthine dehydrogenase YagT iron-sulfur-binding subunit